MQLQIRLSSIATGASVCLLAFSGCGSSSSSGLLSRSQSNSINGALDQVDSAVAAGDCIETANASNRLRAVVNSLQGSVNSALRSSLVDGADTVSQRAANDCALASSSSSTTTSTTTSSQPTSSTTTSSTTSSTTTSTQPTTAPPTTSGTTTDGGGGAQPGAPTTEAGGTPGGGGN